MIIHGKTRHFALNLNHLSTISKELELDFLGAPERALESCGAEEIVNIIWLVLGDELLQEGCSVERFVESITPELAGQMYLTVMRSIVEWLIPIAPAVAVSLILHVAVEGYAIGAQVKEALECAHSRAEEILKSLDLAEEDLKETFNEMLTTMEQSYAGQN